MITISAPGVQDESRYHDESILRNIQQLRRIRSNPPDIISTRPQAEQGDAPGVEIIANPSLNTFASSVETLVSIMHSGEQAIPATSQWEGGKCIDDH